MNVHVFRGSVAGAGTARRIPGRLVTPATSGADGSSRLVPCRTTPDAATPVRHAGGDAPAGHRRHGLAGSPPLASSRAKRRMYATWLCIRR
jgi:hypothetical protein